MSRRVYLLGVGLLLVALALLVTDSVLTPPRWVTLVKMGRVRPGMTLREVESILGPAGPDYSSDLRRGYYIWKSRVGWTRVWVSQGKVDRVEFDPTLSADD
jgi:hypothetical protein